MSFCLRCDSLACICYSDDQERDDYIGYRSVIRTQAPFACCFWNLDQPTERGRKDALDLCLATSGGCLKSDSEKGQAAVSWIDERTDAPSMTRWMAEVVDGAAE